MTRLSVAAQRMAMPPTVLPTADTRVGLKERCRAPAPLDLVDEQTVYDHKARIWVHLQRQRILLAKKTQLYHTRFAMLYDT